MRFAWLIPQAILALTFLLALILRARIPRLPIVAFQADIGTFIAILGFFVAVLASLALFFRDRLQQTRTRVVQEAQEDRRNFLRRLDHELKNPITAIFMGLANLRNTSRSTEEVSYLESIDAHARRLQRLTADLRKLADLDNLHFEQASVDLANLLRETFSYVENSSGAKSRIFSLTLPDVPWPLPIVRGDYDLLQLAFHNLLDNAVKFSEKGDSIELRAYEDGKRVVVEIADSGPGIPAKEIPLVWTELYRGEGVRGTPGSGLGLALTQAIIKRHSGEVALRSRLGEGTVATVRLPTF